MTPPQDTPDTPVPVPPSTLPEEDRQYAERWGIPPEAIPVLTDVVIDDGKPVDSIFCEKNMRLLVSQLYDSWRGPSTGVPFVVFANVGLFHTWRQPPLVPDVMLSLNVRWPSDPRKKENNSYFGWIIGKLPDCVIEIVANREGGEDSTKLQEYARIGIRYYAIFDPENLLGAGALRAFELRQGVYRLTNAGWLDGIGLGLTLWLGTNEHWNDSWLRWCDRDGQVIPTGMERVEQLRCADDKQPNVEEDRLPAEQAHQESERLRTKLRELGIEPPA